MTICVKLSAHNGRNRIVGLGVARTRRAFHKRKMIPKLRQNSSIEILKKSTIHGFNDIGESATKTKKSIWLFVLAFSAGFMCFEVWSIVRYYNENPRSTKFSIEETHEPYFPKILVCPTQFIDPVKLKNKGLRYRTPTRNPEGSMQGFLIMRHNMVYNVVPRMLGGRRVRPVTFSPITRIFAHNVFYFMSPAKVLSFECAKIRLTFSPITSIRL